MNTLPAAKAQAQYIAAAELTSVVAVGALAVALTSRLGRLGRAGIGAAAALAVFVALRALRQRASREIVDMVGQISLPPSANTPIFTEDENQFDVEIFDVEPGMSMMYGAPPIA